MWFIQANMIYKVLIAAVIFSLFILCAKKTKLMKFRYIFSTLLSSVVLFLFSYKLALIYIAYVIITHLMIRLIGKLKKSKKVAFVIMCVLFVSPFVLWRIFDLSSVFETIVLVGFSYNMLKAVDALFYVYYTDIAVPFINYANFILFFPVFTAGPIFRYRDFARQFEQLKVISVDDINTGIKRFIMGLFKKVVLVTVLTMVFDRLAIIESFHWYTSLAIILLAYIVLYVDLSGYSDMAVGVGRLMGITVPENFKKPWTAASFTQFWRKWHVTLSDWIREHIFVVVQDKKLNKYQSALIGLITMIVMSLWHEFSVITVIGGIYMGLFLVIENIFSLSTFNVRKEKKIKYIIRCFFVNFFFAINALTFSLDFGKILDILKGLVR